jgi:hypothetical protein
MMAIFVSADVLKAVVVFKSRSEGKGYAAESTV